MRGMRWGGIGSSPTISLVHEMGSRARKRELTHSDRATRPGASAMTAIRGPAWSRASTAGSSLRTAR